MHCTFFQFTFGKVRTGLGGTADNVRQTDVEVIDAGVIEESERLRHKSWQVQTFPCTQNTKHLHD